MDDVLGELGGEVAADRAGQRVSRVRCPHQRADAGDCALAADGERKHGARGDERDEVGVERLALVLGVVLGCERTGDLQEPHTAQLIAAPLEAGDDLAGKAAAHAVGLDEDERGFGSHSAASLARFDRRLDGSAPRGYTGVVRFGVALTLLGLAAVLWSPVGPAGAEQIPTWFKTPGGAAYCCFTDSGWRCVRPADGFWVELTNPFETGKGSVGVAQGYSKSFRGVRPKGVRTLGFGRQLETSDAAVITCWSRQAGVTCKHYTGLAFQLGRASGYRIYYEIPGFRPTVHPLFRTGGGTWCGIDQDTQVPEKPDLLCWRPTDGLVVGVAYHSRRGYHYREEQVLSYRPTGFARLPAERAFTWRCRSVTEFTAERCRRPQVCRCSRVGTRQDA